MITEKNPKPKQAAEAVAGKRVKVDRENRKTVGLQFVEHPRMTCRNVDVYYGDKQAIFKNSIDVGRREVLAMIGPSGCGKSTFLRCSKPHERHHRHLPG